MAQKAQHVLPYFEVGFHALKLRPAGLHISSVQRERNWAADVTIGYSWAHEIRRTFINFILRFVYIIYTLLDYK